MCVPDSIFGGSRVCPDALLTLTFSACHAVSRCVAGGVAGGSCTDALLSALCILDRGMDVHAQLDAGGGTATHPNTSASNCRRHGQPVVGQHRGCSPFHRYFCQQFFLLKLAGTLTACAPFARNPHTVAGGCQHYLIADIPFRCVRCGMPLDNTSLKARCGNGMLHVLSTAGHEVARDDPMGVALATTTSASSFVSTSSSTRSLM